MNFFSILSYVIILMVMLGRITKYETEIILININQFTKGWLCSISSLHLEANECQYLRQGSEEMLPYHLHIIKDFLYDQMIPIIDFKLQMKGLKFHTVGVTKTVSAIIIDKLCGDLEWLDGILPLCEKWLGSKHITPTSLIS